MTLVLKIAWLFALPAAVGLVTSSAPISFGVTGRFGRLIAEVLSRVDKQTT